MESNWKTQSRIRFGYPKSNSIIRILKKNEFESELANSSQHYGLILAKFEFKSGYFFNLYLVMKIQSGKSEFKPEFMKSFHALNGTNKNMICNLGCLVVKDDEIGPEKYDELPTSQIMLIIHSNGDLDMLNVQYYTVVKTKINNRR